MGLYRRKDSPFYWMSFRANGHRVYESTGTDNKRMAERIHAQKVLEIAEAKLTGKASSRTADGLTPFSSLASQYLVWAERQKAVRNKRTFCLSLNAAFGTLALRELTTQLAERYQSTLSASGKKPATANRHIACLKHMISKAVEWELVDETVLKRVRRAKLLPEHNRRLRYLSTEESAALVAACDAHLRPVVVLALNTGMRKEEILSLVWERHVDLRHGFLLLDITKNGERREVPINTTLRRELGRIVRRLDCPYVFADEQGKRYHNVKRSFASACRRAGLKDFRFHDLRHTFASQLVMAGVDLTTVSRLLGHKSLTMTLRYSHLAPAHLAKAVAVLDGPDSGYDLVTLQKRGFGLKAETP
ncbi:MAG: site-specific integrase [Deltaproteobacteria bacterium]|nr:site-specific integrase [Deltaproteobacteria bacterium]